MENFVYMVYTYIRIPMDVLPENKREMTPGTSWINHS